MSYVAAFRAYEWTEAVTTLAARFFAACPGGRHVVLMNEERGAIDVGGYEKIAHGVDFSHLGLPERPAGRSLWFNGDYAYAHLRLALPDFEHYLIVESDVSVNLSLEPMMHAVSSRRIDLLVHQVRPCLPSWPWFEMARAQHDPHCAGLFAIVASGRALDLILCERQELARQVRGNEGDRWPIVESFVVTTVRNAGMHLGEIGDHAETALLRTEPAFSLNDPATRRPGSIVHPVLGARSLVDRLLGSHPPGDYDLAGSGLQRVLVHEPLAEVAPSLWAAFIAQADHHGLARLRADMQAQRVPIPETSDLAFGKPATLSSVCQWSAVQDRDREAAGGNGGTLHEICAFHTAAEQDAWWMVDLLARYDVGSMEIVNRADFGDRFGQFAVESSDDGVEWRVRFSKTDALPVSGDADRPWRLCFDPAFACRLVRIRRLGPPGFLHLRRVRVFEAAAEVSAPARTFAGPGLLAEASDS